MNRSPAPAVLLVVLALAGCSAAEEPPLPSIVRIGSASEVSRPLDPYLAAPDQILRRAAADEVRVNECLEDGGFGERFTYPDAAELEAFVRSGVADRVVRSSLWGYFDTESVATEGYQRSGAPDSVTLPALSPEATKACLTYDDAPSPLMLIDESSLPGGGPPVPLEDSRYRAAVQEWARCMAEAGHLYESPFEPLTEFVDEVEPSPAQVATAEADLGCKRQTNLVGIAVAVQEAYDLVYIEEHREELEAFLHDLDG